MNRPGFVLALVSLLPLPLLADGAPAAVPAAGTFAAAQETPPGTGDLPISDREGVLAAFQEKYAKAKQPRLLLYINRDLVRDRGEMTTVAKVDGSTKVVGDTVPVAGAGPTNVQIGSNQSAPGGSGTALNPTATGAGGERQDSSSLSVRVKDGGGGDKGVAPINDYDARQIEELFAQPFFDAGARFLDQKVAATLLKPFGEAGPRFLTAPETDREKSDTESLKKSADIVIEILARKRIVTIPTPGGDRREERLALTATAIDLRQPGVILGRVSTDTLFGFNGRDGEARMRKAKKVVSSEIIDQAALALMNRIAF